MLPYLFIKLRILNYPTNYGENPEEPSDKVYAIEVGYRGFALQSVFKAFNVLGMAGRKRRKASGYISEAA